MRRLLKILKLLGAISVPVVLISSVLGLLGYMHASKDLPPLDSEFDVEKSLRTTIEGERRNLRPEAGIIRDDVTWPKPNLADYPHDFVVMYVAQWGCPTFFQTPREPELQWLWRMLQATVFKRELPGRDGRCELKFARHLAYHLRVANGPSQLIAAYRLRAALQKDQLVAYDLAALPLQQGYFGLHDASRLLLHRSLSSLSLAELAELSIAMPPRVLYEEVRVCTQTSGLKQIRNDLLRKLGTAGLIPVERTRAAQGEPLGCERSGSELLR